MGWDGVSTYRKGKNLLNISDDNIIYENYSRTTDGSYYQINNNIIKLYNATAGARMICFPITSITESMINTVFTLSFESSGAGDCGIYISDLDGSNRTPNKNNPYTILISDIGKLLCIRIRINGYTGLYTVSNIQLELGSTATSYEPYHGSTTNYEFGVLGKNKLDEQKYADITNYPNKGKYNYKYTDPIILAPNTTYKFSFTPRINDYETVRYWAVKVYDDAYEDINDTGTVKYLVNATYYIDQNITTGKKGAIRFAVFGGQTTLDEIWDRTTVQLELGSTATAYEPYDPKHTVYGGWVDLITGEVCEEWIKLTKKLSDCTSKTIYDNGMTYYNYNPLSELPCYANQADNTINGKYSKCSIAKHSWSSQTLITNHYYMFRTTDNQTRMLLYLLSDSVESDDMEFEFAFQLATPNTYNLAPTALQTFLGQNNVWSNADYVEVEYDLHETQDILARKQFIIANQPHLEEVSGNIATFNTDMKAPLKECKIYFEPIQSGSGDPSPENVRPISGWDGCTINTLPSEYQEVEAIESSNKAYIKTKIKPYLGLCSEIIINGNSNAILPFSCGSANNTDYYGWNCTANSEGRIVPYLGTGKYPMNIYGYQIKNNFHTLTIDEKKFYFDNTLIYDYANDTNNTFNFSNAIDIIIGGFWMGNESNVTAMPFITKTVKFWDKSTGIYLGYFIPCYRKSDNEYGLYDIVTNEFYSSNNDYKFIQYGSTINRENSIAISWQSNIGTIYGGYVDLVKGELVAEYEMLSDTWGNWGTVTDQGDGTELRYKKFTNPVYGDRQGNNISYCNVAKYHYTNNNGEVHFYISSTSYNCRIYLPSGTDTNLQIQAVGKLITPITYQLTPTQLKTLRGTNNIWAANGGDNIEIKYWKH